MERRFASFVFGFDFRTPAEDLVMAEYKNSYPQKNYLPCCVR
jgi:hypothetical protein